MVNTRAMKEFEKLRAEQKACYEKFLSFKMDNATMYKCTETDAESWIDIPEQIA